MLAALRKRSANVFPVNGKTSKLSARRAAAFVLNVIVGGGTANGFAPIIELGLNPVSTPSAAMIALRVAAGSASCKEPKMEPPNRAAACPKIK